MKTRLRELCEMCSQTELVRISPVNVDGKAIVTVNVKAIEDLKADCAAKDTRIAELEEELTHIRDYRRENITLEARVDRQSKLILAKEEVKQELLGLLERALTVLPSSRRLDDESWAWAWDTLSSEAQAEVEEVWDELQAALKVKEKEE